LQLSISVKPGTPLVFPGYRTGIKPPAIIQKRNFQSKGRHKKLKPEAEVNGRNFKGGGMSNYLLLVVMFFAGITVAVQPSVNARLAQKVGILESACISFAVGTLFLLVVLLAAGRLNLKGLGETVWWEWTGGLFGAIFVTATIMIMPRIGTTATLAATIAAQLMTGVLLDHFGAFGFKVMPFDLKRFAGCLLLIGGVMLIGKR
jgi:transporter family-2 protein